MFKDEESFSGGEGHYTIFVCEGESKPQTIAEVKQRALGSCVWDQQGFDVEISIERTGFVHWLALYDGLAIITRPVGQKLMAISGQPLTAHIKKK